MLPVQRKRPAPIVKINVMPVKRNTSVSAASRLPSVSSQLMSDPQYSSVRSTAPLNFMILTTAPSAPSQTAPLVSTASFVPAAITSKYSCTSKIVMSPQTLPPSAIIVPHVLRVPVVTPAASCPSASAAAPSHAHTHNSGCGETLILC